MDLPWAMLRSKGRAAVVAPPRVASRSCRQGIMLCGAYSFPPCDCCFSLTEIVKVRFRIHKLLGHFRTRRDLARDDSDVKSCSLAYPRFSFSLPSPVSICSMLPLLCWPSPTLRDAFALTFSDLLPDLSLFIKICNTAYRSGPSRYHQHFESTLGPA